MVESLLFTIYRWRNRHWVLETWSRFCSKKVAQSTLAQIFQCEDLISQPLCCWERKGNVCYKEPCGSHWYWSSHISGALSLGTHGKLHFSIDFGDRHANENCFGQQNGRLHRVSHCHAEGEKSLYGLDSMFFSQCCFDWVSDWICWLCCLCNLSKNHTFVIWIHW